MIEFDQQLLLMLNGWGDPLLDQIMWTVTKTATWLPMAAALLYVVWRNNSWREALMIVLGVALVILLADRVSSGVFKPLFHRFRPSHEPVLEGMVQLVRGYKGGMYGFISSHAANTFGVATFISLLVRSRRMTATVVTWACLSSYSRIYLGVHYPGDILAGALWGLLVGYVCYRLYTYSSHRWLSPESISTGYRPKDINIFAALFCATIACVIVAAIVSTWQ